jgi:hypothetical protein
MRRSDDRIQDHGVEHAQRDQQGRRGQSNRSRQCCSRQRYHGRAEKRQQVLTLFLKGGFTFREQKPRELTGIFVLKKMDATKTVSAQLPEIDNGPQFSPRAIVVFICFSKRTLSAAH